MKKYRHSVLNSVLSGILICGILAACGVAEKNFAAPEPISAVATGIPTFTSVSVSDTDPGPGAEPGNEKVTPDDAEAPVEEDIATENEISETAQKIIDIAEENLGVKYASNRCTPEEGFDSSGLVYYCFKEAGIEVPRRVKDQLRSGDEVGYDDLRAGDIVFFSAEEGGKANFCGIYAGGGLIIYSPAPGGSVKTANITTGYWTARFVSGARYF